MAETPEMPSTDTTEDNERPRSTRSEVRKQLFWISFLTTALGIIHIAAGIVIMVYVNRDEFPLKSAGQIWSGTLMFLVGVCGFLTYRMAGDSKAMLLCTFGTFYGFALATFACAFPVLAWDIMAVLSCAEDSCDSHGNLVLVLEAISIPIVVIQAVASLAGAKIFMEYRQEFNIFFRGDPEREALQGPLVRKTPTYT